MSQTLGKHPRESEGIEEKKDSILSIPDNEFDFFNVKFPAIEEFGNRQLRAFWMPTDISYKDDAKDFNSLDKNTQRALEMTIGFFFSSDGIVFKNLGENFMDEFKLPEIRYVYTAFETLEQIHAKSYGLQLQSIIQDPKKQQKLMYAIRTIPSIQQMADWAVSYMNRNTSTLLERMVAFLAVEGIFFSSPFAFIFWLRKYHPKKLTGIVGANDLISRDENLHCEFAIYLINILLQEGHKSEKLRDILMSAVLVASEFVKDCFPEKLLAMNADLMITHVKSVANRLAQQIGLTPLYSEVRETPFKFLELISLEIKKNFFERQVVEYQKAPQMNIDFSYKPC